MRPMNLNNDENAKAFLTLLQELEANAVKCREMLTTGTPQFTRRQLRRMLVEYEVLIKELRGPEKAPEINKEQS